MPAHATRMPSGSEVLGVVGLNFGARIRREDQEVRSARSIRPALLAHITQSLIIFACAGPNLGLPTVVGLKPSINLNTCGFTPAIGFGREFVILANTS